MKYPSRSDYVVSIRNPGFAFRKVDVATKRQIDLDTALLQGQVVQRVQANGMQDVWSASGGYAIAFKYETDNATKTWAVRCFFRANYDVERHYTQALAHLNNSACKGYFVDFFYLGEGIRVTGDCYPILKMEWIEGPNLKQYIKENLQNRAQLMQLAERWHQLSNDLLQAGIAHGDLQHGNILVQEGSQAVLKLIDYDSLYFRVDNTHVVDGIKGLPGYQPPARKTLQHRCLEIDFFPQLVIYLSILALAETPSLWDTCQLDHTDCLLFSSHDFLKPDEAKIFETLATLPEPVSRLTHRLKQLCKTDDLKTLPPLEVILSGRSPSPLTYQQPQNTMSLVDSNPPSQPDSASRNLSSPRFSRPTKTLLESEDSSPEMYREWAQEYYLKKSKDLTFNFK